MPILQDRSVAIIATGENLLDVSPVVSLSIIVPYDTLGLIPFAFIDRRGSLPHVFACIAQLCSLLRSSAGFTHIRYIKVLNPHDADRAIFLGTAS